MPVLTRRYELQGRKYDSYLSNLDALQICRTLTGPFITSICQQYDRTGSLSVTQWNWIHKLANEANRPAPETVALENVLAIVALFSLAHSRLQKPKIHLSCNGEPVVFTLAVGRAKEPGSIKVSDGGPYGASVWYGRIRGDGTFEPGKNCTPEVIDLVKRFASDPAGVAAAEGHRSGHCCFCDAPLDDPRSVEVGYGPTCAKNWGLAWGSRKSRSLPQVNDLPTETPVEI